MIAGLYGRAGKVQGRVYRCPKMGVLGGTCGDPTNKRVPHPNQAAGSGAVFRADSIMHLSMLKFDGAVKVELETQDARARTRVNFRTRSELPLSRIQSPKPRSRGDKVRGLPGVLSAT